MNSTRLRLLAAATLVTLAACSDERSITSEPVGDLGFGQNLLKQATNLPRGRTLFRGNSRLPSANPANDSIYVDLAGLDSLSSGQYTIWVGNDSSTKFARLTGTLTIAVLDTTINAAGDAVVSARTVVLPGVSAFSNGRHNYTMRFATTRAGAAGLTATDSTGVVLVSIESGTIGATPGDRRILWSRRGAATATADTFSVIARDTVLYRVAGFRFGNFAPQPANEFVYATTVGSRAFALALANIQATTPIIPRGRIEKRGSLFTVNDSNYYRPPIGYFYQAFAIRTDTLGRWIDTVSLGIKATPYPKRISFYEADRTIVDPDYMFGTPTPVIYASQHRVSADTIEAARPNGIPWSEFSFVYVTLQNKAAPVDRMGAVAIMTVGTPGSISGR